VFTEAKDDGSGGNNWSYKSCKARDKSSPPTNQQCQSTDGKNITFPGLVYPKLTWGSSNFVFDH